MTTRTQIFSDIDYAKDGKQVDWLYLPHSVTRSAYGNIAIPVAVIKNGEGPTALLTAGTHGDEYEGQIALCRLVRSIRPSDISGRIIVLTAANLPAAMAGARVSPIDGGNLNRAYPGDASGTPTFAIAHYVNSVLLPLANFYFDCHAGGSSLQYEPFVSMRKSDNPELDQRALAALKAFGAPMGLVWVHAHGTGLAVSSAIQRGIVTLGGEFGSAGSVSRHGVAIVERGIRNLLAHAGIMSAASNSPPMVEPRLIEVRNRDYYVLSPGAGVFEPAVELGEEIETGQLCGELHFVDDPVRAPLRAYFRTAGRVICKRHIGRVERGDCVAHLATPLSS
ncbi:MAG: succinylglutamate desuccinylase/aspartoacylase family protein [Betaproteobacteria bacterium]